ncbi:MAG TPA: hypothetical protein VNL35_20800 [Chloroflexota bacterium]|nr:hypothetical protein [Chloroflexota bacterium]
MNGEILLLDETETEQRASDWYTFSSMYTQALSKMIWRDRTGSQQPLTDASAG